METAWRKFALLQWKTNFLMATPWIIARYKAFGATFKMTLTSPQQTPMHSTINYKNVWGKKIKLSKSNFLRFEKYFSQIYFPIFFWGNNKNQTGFRNNYDPTCLAPYGGPIFSPLAVGGHRQENQTNHNSENYLLASGLSLTFLVNNALNKTQLTNALQWEKLWDGLIELTNFFNYQN